MKQTLSHAVPSHHGSSRASVHGYRGRSVAALPARLARVRQALTFRNAKAAIDCGWPGPVTDFRTILALVAKWLRPKLRTKEDRPKCNGQTGPRRRLQGTRY